MTNEETRYRQRQARMNIGPAPFSGIVTESIEDFFTDFERYLNNCNISEEQASRYLPDFLIGTAREFFRTLNQQQLQNIITIRQAFIAQFATQARRQAALQNFYQAQQLSNETGNQYCCRLKTLARAAFHDQDQAVRAQHVAARMKQGLRAEIKRALIGHELGTAEELRATIEGIEMEMAAASVEAAPADRGELRDVIQALKATILECKQRPPTVNAMRREKPRAIFSARNRMNGPFPTNVRETRSCFRCGCKGHVQHDCREFNRSSIPTNRFNQVRFADTEYERQTGRRPYNNQQNREQSPNPRMRDRQQDVTNRSYTPPRCKPDVNAVQKEESEWPEENNGKDSDEGKQLVDTSEDEKEPRKETTQQAHGSREINYHPLYMAGINSNT